MRTASLLILCLSVLAATGAGCGQSHREDLVFERGLQMLAGGSPRLAVPVFSQVISSVPDGPEPHAMLALAYALDLQPDRAVRHAEAAESRRAAKEPPGWETVALGLVAMCRQSYDEAVDHLQKVVRETPPESGIRRAAAQWLVLALLLKDDRRAGLDCLNTAFLGEGATSSDRATPAERTTALLWSALVHGRYGETQEAAKALSDVAGHVSGGRARGAPPSGGAADEAVGALARGDLRTAEEKFKVLESRPESCNASVWLALIAAAQGKWDQTCEGLKRASEEATPRSRGLARSLLAVVCALDGRPQEMIHHTLAGQRLLRQDRFLPGGPTEAKPDTVWLSDRLNP